MRRIEETKPVVREYNPQRQVRRMPKVKLARQRKMAEKAHCRPGGGVEFQGSQAPRRASRQPSKMMVRALRVVVKACLPMPSL
jgi:hypothetical protein